MTATTTPIRAGAAVDVTTTRLFHRTGEPAVRVAEYADGRTEVEQARHEAAA